MKNYVLPIVFASTVGFSMTIIRQEAHAQNADQQSVDNTGAMTSRAAANTNNQESPPPFLSEIPAGYRDWRLIAVSRLTSPKGSQLRAELANDIAIKAYREGKLPFPDGAIVVALHWNEVSSEENNKVLAQGFPGAGIQSFVPGSGVNIQFMVKDSKKYATTGGWGFGDFTNGKPGNAALMKTCFGCHVPAEDRDFIFTRYAP